MSPGGKACFSVALVVAAIVTNTAHAYTITRCIDAGEAAIDRLQIDREKIAEVKTDKLVSGGENLYVTGYLLWMKSNACKGSLVLSLRADCSFLDTFTRGDCSLAHFRR